TLDGDHVEAHVAVELAVVVEPRQRQRPDALLLDVVDRDRRTAVARTAAGLHLAEDDQVVAAGDDVELTPYPPSRRTPVPVDDVEPDLAEVGGGAALAPVTPRAVREVRAQNSRFSRTLAALPTRSRR